MTQIVQSSLNERLTLILRM